MLDKEAYQRDRKAETDSALKARRGACGRAIQWAQIEYTGDNTTTLRPRDLVQARRLKAGDNLMDKEYVKLRIAEEAKLRGINIKWTASTKSRVVATGDKFDVTANLNETHGWVIKEANIRSGDNGVGDLEEVNNDDDDDEDEDEEEDGDVDDETSKRIVRTPLTSDWIVPLIKKAITVKPNIFNSDLRHILRPYCRKYALTRGLLQKARDKARLENFGSPLINAQYFEALQQELELRGNHVEIVMTNRDVAISKLQTLIVADEIIRRKEDNKPVLLNNESEARLFLQLWTDENQDFIREHFGSEDDNCKFVLGILFAPRTVTNTVRYLQNVYQADAAHLQFGKYTFYSAYGSTANSNASPVAFAILFGNEDKSNWTRFWTFANKLHPQLDHKEITIITDQDKGSKAAECKEFSLFMASTQ